MGKKLICLVFLVFGMSGFALGDDFSWLCENDAKIDGNFGDENYGQSGGECHPGRDRTVFLMSWDFSSVAAWSASSDGMLHIPHVYWREDGLCAGLYELVGGPFDESTVTYNSYIGAGNLPSDVFGGFLGANCDDQHITFTVPQATIQGLINGTIDGLALSNPAGEWWNHCLGTGEGVGVEPYLEFSAEIGGAAHNPNPADGATEVPSNQELSWNTGLDPNDPNVPNPAITGHYLWLSRAYDPANPPSMQGWWNDADVQTFYIPGNDVTGTYSPPGGLQMDALYYWVVDESLGATSETDVANLILGNTWWFSTETTGPEVDAGSSIVTWLEGGSTTVNLIGTVDLSGDVAGIQWSVLWRPSGSTVSIADASAAATTATLTELGLYVLELYAIDQQQQEDSDRMEINVYSDSCEAAKNHPDGYSAPAYDFNGDCAVDFIDFAMFADDWLDDSSLVDDGLYDAGEITFPFVEFTNPLEGATVSGSVAINAMAYDPSVGTTDGDGMEGAGGIDFEIVDNSGSVLGSHHEDQASFDWTWDTTSGAYPNGVYTLRVIALSDAGYTAIQEISITVNNP